MTFLGVEGHVCVSAHLSMDTWAVSTLAAVAMGAQARVWTCVFSSPGPAPMREGLLGHVVTFCCTVCGTAVFQQSLSLLL